MIKPDWAERLQRTFRRKYEQGVADTEARIIEIVKSKRWVGETLNDDEANLVALIKGEK